jgi:hypothetical protein
MELSWWFWDEEDDLDRAAVCLNCPSRRKIFQLAGEGWHIPQERIDRDYLMYQIYELIPYYVKDLVRQV